MHQQVKLFSITLGTFLYKFRYIATRSVLNWWLVRFSPRYGVRSRRSGRSGRPGWLWRAGVIVWPRPQLLRAPECTSSHFTSVKCCHRGFLQETSGKWRFFYAILRCAGNIPSFCGGWFVILLSGVQWRNYVFHATKVFSITELSLTGF